MSPGRSYGIGLNGRHLITLKINRFLFLHEFSFIKLLFVKNVISSFLITELPTVLYLGIYFFANPEIVAKANIPNRAIP